ncbi:DUF2894 domain-containing protein [Dyella ginsengisoli]|uniref:DUF2894 domain-containing protein n=1 Tax=Dyella ginsengisoli TaxID=363848 RepID=A0ABW8JN44_9GAMM
MRPDTTSAIRAQLIAALEQRAANLDGAARCVLDARLTELRALDADARDEQRDANGASPVQSPLRELTDQLTREAPADRAAYPDIPALADFRQLWSTLRADSQLQQTVAHTPTDAGPLNSAALASRAIALMRDTSPGYLRAFLAYVDDLAWLEQLGTAGTATQVTAAKKRAARKPPR